VPDHRTGARERRDPTAGTLNSRFAGVGTTMLPEWDAAAAIRSAYYANIFVYRCVQVRARALAALPFRVGADPAKPKDHNPTAPLAQLLGPPPGGAEPHHHRPEAVGLDPRPEDRVRPVRMGDRNRPP
jgi:hypothetical protein